MTKEDIITGHSLILDFLGFDKRNTGTSIFYQVPNHFPEDLHYESGYTEWSPECIEFMTRWDYLMPVVKICLSSYMQLDGFKVNSKEDKQLYHSLNYTAETIQQELINVNIDKVYNAVCAFISLYNSCKHKAWVI